jgi:hybrid cluster-associated redox disulfide protein
MSEAKKITKDMTFGQVLEQFPETVEIFFMYGMHCIGCMIAPEETIEQGAMVHGIPIDQLVDELNKKVETTAKEKSPESSSQ